jgi:hypothetical protein
MASVGLIGKKHPKSKSPISKSKSKSKSKSRKLIIPKKLNRVLSSVKTMPTPKQTLKTVSIKSLLVFCVFL